MCSTVVSLIFCSSSDCSYRYLCVIDLLSRLVKWKRDQERQVGRPSKKKTESATQQYKVADIDPHNYDVFETRYQQYMAKPSHTGEKWSVKFGARSAPVSPRDTSDMDTDEGQLITQQVLQTALEHERKRQKKSEITKA